MALFGPKGFAAEVTEGIDLESRITLSGDRVTIGNGPNDDLTLGATDSVPAHLTFQRRADGQWEYFTTGRAETQIDRGNNRTGSVRAGMWFQIGRETKITIKKAEVTDKVAKTGDSTVPLTLAIPAILIMIVCAGLYVFSQRDVSNASGLRTAAWYTGQSDLSAALEDCLSHDLTPPDYATANAIDGPFWSYMAATDSAAKDTARARLLQNVQNTLSEAHLLSFENRNLDASKALRRIEYVLPLERQACPILSAARIDIALLELRGNR